MKSLVSAAILGAFLIVAVSAVSRADAPITLLRKLQDLRDESAFGIGAAQGRRQEIDARLEASIIDPASGWKDRRNLVAFTSFLLAGGDPGLARRAISLMPRDTADATLMRHALAYADGETSQASKQLEMINVRTVSPEIAGTLALVQAKLVMDHDRRIARERLLAARILSPGGLIEEASLRQELFILDKDSDPGSVQKIVSRYFSRFYRSAYVENFVQRLEVFSEQMWLSRPPETRTNAIRFLDELPPTMRSQIALRLARMSLIIGNRAAVRQALQIACADQPSNESAAERCALYKQIDQTVDVEWPRDRKISLESSIVQLSDEDRLLLECANLVKAREEDPSAGRQDRTRHEESEAIRRIQEPIAEARLLLKESR